MSKVKVGIVADIMGSMDREPEEEADEIIKHLRAMGLDCELKEFSTASHGVTNKNIDMLVIDYGGMSYGSYDTSVSHVRGCAEWAREHPGKLMVVWTLYTQNIYEDELLEEFGNLDNVLFSYNDNDCVDKLIEWYHPGHNISEDGKLITPPGIR